MVNTHGFKAYLIGGTALSLVALTPQQVFAQSTPTPTVGLEDIIVTAQKRSQSAQDVPISITALSANALETNRITNVSDLNAMAPNLTVRESQGGAGVPGITLRGEFGYGVSAGTDRGVAMYVDGVFLGGAQGAIFDLADIDRIEVLKGPQGTLFGRASTAGAINLTTHTPSGELALHQEVTVGNYNQFRSKTRIDLPAFGPIVAGVTYTHSERRGDTRNLLPGIVWDYANAGQGTRTSSRYLGDQNIESVLATVRFDNGGTVRATYKFDYTDSDGTPAAIGTIRNNLDLLGPDIAALYAAQDPALMTPVTKHRPSAVNNGFHTPNNNSSWGHNLTVAWTPNNVVSVKDIIAWRGVKTKASSSLQGVGTLVANQDPFVPFELYDADSSSKYRQFSNELQLSINTSLVTLTTGYLHFVQKIRSGSFAEDFPNTPNFFTGTLVPGAPGISNDVVRGKSDAVFAQAEFHVTPKLDVVGGYRMTWDKKDATSAAPVGDPPTQLRVSTSYSQATPSVLAGVNYQATNDLLLYGKYSTGYLSGGSLAGLNYERERAYSWELGVKSDWFEHRLRANLSLFSVKYDNIQISSGGLATLGHLLAQSGFAPGTPEYVAVQNRYGYLASFGVTAETVGDGKAKGFELEVTALPIEGLTLSGALGYTDFKYTRILPGIATYGKFYPNFRPKWTANASAQYETEPFYKDARLLLRVDGNFQSANLTYPDIRASDKDLFTVDAHWIINARAAIKDIDMGGHKLEVAAWVKNLTNSDRIAYTQEYGFTTGVTYELARTFGVDLKLDF